MDALDIAKVASHYMFGLFLTGTVLAFISIFLSPFEVSSRPPQSITSNPETNALTRPHRRRTFIFLRALPLTFFSFFTALTTIVASAIATVMFMIFKNVFTDNSQAQELNIKAEIGTRMLVYMWAASACVFIGFIIQVASCCCACCGGRKARKALKNNPEGIGTGVETKENGSGSSLKSRFRFKRANADV